MLELLTRTDVSLGRIRRIPIGLNTSWFAVFALVIWTLGSGYFPQIASGARPTSLLRARRAIRLGLPDVAAETSFAVRASR